MLYSILRLPSVSLPHLPAPCGSPGLLASQPMVSRQRRRPRLSSALGPQSAGGVCVSTTVALGCLRTKPHFFLLLMLWSMLEEASINICHENFAAVKQKLHVDTWMRLLQPTPQPQQLLSDFWQPASHPSPAGLRS